MADELDDEERALLEQHRAEKRKAAEDDKEIWIREGDAEASVPYSKGRSWLQRKFGIDLDEEPVQDAPEPAPKLKAAPKQDEGRDAPRFISRRSG